MLNQKTMMEAYRQGVLTKMAELGVKPEAASGILKSAVNWGRMGKALAMSSGITGSTALPYLMGANETQSFNPITNTASGYRQLIEGAGSAASGIGKGLTAAKDAVNYAALTVNGTGPGAENLGWRGAWNRGVAGPGKGGNGAGTTGGMAMRQKLQSAQQTIGARPNNHKGVGYDMGMNSLTPGEYLTANQKPGGQVPSWDQNKSDRWNE